MELKTVALKELVPNPAQPEGRNRQIVALSDSILNHGLINPIHVTKEMVIIDGHRRYEALKNLGVEETTVLVYGTELKKGALTHAEAMSVANTFKNFTTRNKIHVYLKGGMISGSLLKQIDELVGRFGKRIIKSIQDLKLSPRVALEFLELIDFDKKASEQEFYNFVAWSRKYKLAAELNYIYRMSHKAEYDLLPTQRRMWEAFKSDKSFTVEIK